MTLDWKGDQVLAKMRKAQRFGVNKTMGQAVEHAKRNHAWQNRTGTLEGCIYIVEFAAQAGRGYRGEWGSKDVRYALIHELGGRIEPVKGKFLKFRVDGNFVSVKSVTIPARPYLRPAADAIYPQLAGNINEGMSAP